MIENYIEKIGNYEFQDANKLLMKQMESKIKGFSGTMKGTYCIIQSFKSYLQELLFNIITSLFCVCPFSLLIPKESENKTNIASSKDYFKLFKVLAEGFSELFPISEESEFSQLIERYKLI